MLIVGDGNFSFSASVTKMVRRGEAGVFEQLTGLELPVDILCTSFDQEEELLEKYPECNVLLPSIRESRVARVQHGVNAWQLREQFPERQFDCVIWNHPHLGTEDFNLHRFLMCHFFHSAAQVLVPGGCVVVSVLKGQDARWRLTECAERSVLGCERAVPFEPRDYPGYETRRNRTGGSFQNSHTQRHHADALTSVTYRFRHGLKTSVPEAAVPMPAEEIKAKAPRPKPFECTICGKGFAKAQGLRVHTRQVHELQKYGTEWAPGRERNLKCEDCGAAFRDSEALWQHKIARHSADSEIPHPGPLLGREVPAGGNTYGFFPCEVCGMSVSSEEGWGMAAHLESLKPIVGMALECGIRGCQKRFIELRALRQHRNFCSIQTTVCVPADDQPAPVAEECRGTEG